MADWPYNTKQWRNLRAAHLSRSPMCEACQGMGRLTIANHVDHRTPISAGGHAFPSFDGLASLCASCHSAKTARGVEAGAIRTTKTRKGCNADGTPLDPMHGWNAEKSLRADPSGPAGDRKIELVYNCNRGGRHGR